MFEETSYLFYEDEGKFLKTMFEAWLNLQRKNYNAAKRMLEKTLMKYSPYNKEIVKEKTEWINQLINTINKKGGDIDG